MGERNMKKLKKKGIVDNSKRNANISDDNETDVAGSKQPQTSENIVETSSTNQHNTTEANDQKVVSRPKKRKLDKHTSDSAGAAALGVVDKGILQQAGTNLGLPLLEEADGGDTAATTAGGDDDGGGSDVKRKKKKKDKKKLQKRSQEGAGDAESESQDEDNDKTCRSLSYLRLWSSDKDKWKFNKSNQIHLLTIMYNDTKMLKEDFDLLLEYLVDLKGKSREKTKEDAEKVLKTSGSFFERDRARQIFQLLC